MLNNNISIPLCVDLDGTLIKEDSSLIGLKKYLANNYFNIVKLIFWYATNSNRAYIKEKLAENYIISINDISLVSKVLSLIKAEKEKGRQIYLATGADLKYANVISEYLNIFSGVFASNGKINLIAKEKACLLVKKFGNRGYIYIGNSKSDFPVWNQSYQAIIAPDSNQKVKNKVKKLYKNALIL